MNNDLYSAITEHFENWGQGNSNPVDGFVDWAWFNQDEILDQLKTKNLVDIAFDIEYSLNQVERYRNVDALGDAFIWLFNHREALIEALEKLPRG